MSLSGAFLFFLVGFLIHTTCFESWSFLLTSTRMNCAFQSIKFHTFMSKVKIITFFSSLWSVSACSFCKELEFLVSW